MPSGSLSHSPGLAAGELGGRTEDDGKEFWLPADLPALPEERWPRYLAGATARADALEAVLRDPLS